MNSISECALNGIIAMRGCDTLRLRKHKFDLQKLFDKHVPISYKNDLLFNGGSCYL